MIPIVTMRLEVVGLVGFLFASFPLHVYTPHHPIRGFIFLGCDNLGMRDKSCDLLFLCVVFSLFLLPIVLLTTFNERTLNL